MTIDHDCCSLVRGSVYRFHFINGAAPASIASNRDSGHYHRSTVWSNHIGTVGWKKRLALNRKEKRAKNFAWNFIEANAKALDVKILAENVQ